MSRIYWKIYHFIKDIRRRKFLKMPPGIYYDRVYREWVMSKDPNHICSDRIEDIIESMCDKNLYYPVKIAGMTLHLHYFDFVLLEAYRCGNEFSVDDWMRPYYSEQELEMLEAASKAGANDGNRCII